MKVESYEPDPSANIRKLDVTITAEYTIHECSTGDTSLIRTTAKKVVAHSVHTRTITVPFNAREIKRRQNFTANQTIGLEDISSDDSV